MTFVPTVTNMVTIVRNIIQGYGMGPIRALAQEPVQNSKDAARGHAHVEYQLHERPSGNGAGSYLLTVTDRNTSGLLGPVRSLEDIQAQGEALSEGENWAAFEGMGYTPKDSEDALGSRGQGKAAFLYYSSLPRSDSSGHDRMMMLYDTLLADGEYRLGVRYASPSDTVRTPPFRADEARRIVSSQYPSEDGTEVQLGLEPLTEVGTRVIVPHLSQEAVEAFHSGELYRWLQRCWWRAVQTGLAIDLVDEHGVVNSVSVPTWWETEPWRRPSPGMRLYEHIDADGLKIKRIVLLYDDSLDEPDIDGAAVQFWGVQLLRDQQWIETLGQELSDYIPRDKRSGFRGFVEFDQRAERELKRAENSQHDRFDRRVSGVKALITAIESKVREFAEEQGWTTPQATREAPQVEQDAAVEFLRFLAPQARIRPHSTPGTPGQPWQPSMDLTEHWDCSLGLDFPDPNSTRVNWGQYIRNVRAVVTVQNTLLSLRRCTVSLEAAHADDGSSRVVIASESLELRNGEDTITFGDFRIMRDSSGPEKIQCQQSGKWRLTVLVKSDGATVARASRTIFVHEDPPTRDAYALSISVENHTTLQRRINSGNIIGVQVSVTNRTANDETLELTSSIGDLLLTDRKPVQAPGTPAGDTPVRIPGVQASIVVNPSVPVVAPRQSVNLLPGRHTLRADLFRAGEVEAHAHASRTLDIEVDPVQPEGWPPFRIEQISGDGPYPRWQFEKHSVDDWVLRYPPAYPLYHALAASPSRDGGGLSGVSAFVVDVCAEGIIEWAMEPVGGGDWSRLDTLLDGTPAGSDPERWDKYCDKMRELAGLRGTVESVDDYNRLVRDCAARSLSLFQERG